MDLYRIAVNNVSPGRTRTVRLADLDCNISPRTGVKPEEVFANGTRLIPAGRTGTPEEFAPVMALLAPERAGYANGTSIAIDGGAVRSLF